MAHHPNVQAPDKKKIKTFFLSGACTMFCMCRWQLETQLPLDFYAFARDWNFHSISIWLFGNTFILSISKSANGRVSVFFAKRSSEILFNFSVSTFLNRVHNKQGRHGSRPYMMCIFRSKIYVFWLLLTFSFFLHWVFHNALSSVSLTRPLPWSIAF